MVIKTRGQYSQFMLLDTRTRHDTELLQAAYETIEALRNIARAAHSLDMLLGAIGARANLAEYGPDADLLHNVLAYTEHHAPWLLNE